MGRLQGKTALVVGAGSIGPGWGNGKATATLFAREGARVFCVDRNSDAAADANVSEAFKDDPYLAAQSRQAAAATGGGFKAALNKP